MKTDSIQYEILEDGTISVTTDAVSGINHVSADKLLARMFELAGGLVTVKKRNRLEVGHAHSHGQQTHSH